MSNQQRTVCDPHANLLDVAEVLPLGAKFVVLAGRFRHPDSDYTPLEGDAPDELAFYAGAVQVYSAERDAESDDKPFESSGVWLEVGGKPLRLAFHDRVTYKKFWALFDSALGMLRVGTRGDGTPYGFQKEELGGGVFG